MKPQSTNQLTFVHRLPTQQYMKKFNFDVTASFRHVFCRSAKKRLQDAPLDGEN